MGGLAGVLRRDGARPERADLERMLGAMRHRGPDGAVVLARGPVVLAHLVLATTRDVARAAIADAARGVWLVFDGRLDSRCELASALGLRAADPALSDGALVLEAYLRWGPASVERFIGDFALALWDDRRRVLMCARDPLGIRPFYYHADARAFRWASELQALLADPAVDRRPNEGFLAECLAAHPTSVEETVYAGVRRLPAAHALVVSESDVRVWRYWDPDPRELSGLSDEDYGERLRAVIDEAVAARLRGVPAVGAHLSGGLDSSTVGAAALEFVQRGAVDARRLELFSLVFPGRSFDERDAIRAVERHLGVRATLVNPLPLDAGLALEPVRRYGDLPDYPTGEPLERALLGRARARGLRVILTGIGGDQWLEGSPFWYADLVTSGRLATAWRALAASSEDGGVTGLLTTFGTAGLLPLVPPALRRVTRRVLRRRRAPAWVAPTFARRVDLEDRLEQPPLRPLDGSFARADVKRLLTSGWEALLKEQLERTAAWFGVEYRHPFLDRRVVEFAVALPEAQRQRPGRSKVALRSAMHDRLPPALLARETKVDLSELYLDAAAQLGGRRLVERSALAEAGWVDAGQAHELFSRALGPGSGADRGALVLPVWMIVSIEHWFRAIMLGEESRGWLEGGAPAGRGDAPGGR